MLFIVAGGAFAATMLGGVFALRLRDKLHLILGFSAGAVVAVAFFDLLPESIGLSNGYGPFSVLSFSAFGFLLYLMLDRLLLLHSHAHEEHEHTEARGHLRAGSFSIHSFLDGIAIGLSFQVSATVGLFVAVAVLAHDFSDGINTVSVVVREGGERKGALSWLLIDAFAPVLGILATFFFTVPQDLLGLLLALFSGFFLYVGASDLIPESHHQHPTFFTTLMTLLGAFVLYVAITFAG